MSDDTQTPPESPQALNPPTPRWQRGLGLLAPFFAGVVFLTGIEYAADHETAQAMLNLGLSAGMMFFAWR